MVCHTEILDTWNVMIDQSESCTDRLTNHVIKVLKNLAATDLAKI